MHTISILKFIPAALVPAVMLFANCGGSENTPVADPADMTIAGGFKPIFNGKDLSGWDGDTAYWRVENGILTGEITKDKLLSRNTFIIWQGGQPADFELKLQFRVSDAGNSGINYRSEAVSGVTHALRGYQADIDGARRYTGQNYEERGRTTLAYRGQRVTVPASGLAIKDGVKNNAWSPVQVTGSLGEAEALKSAIKPNDWNECRLVVKGNRMQHFINGTLMSDVTDNDTANRKLKGWLGVQVHVGPPMKVEYKDILLKQ